MIVPACLVVWRAFSLCPELINTETTDLIQIRVATTTVQQQQQNPTQRWQSNFEQALKRELRLSQIGIDNKMPGKSRSFSKFLSRFSHLVSTVAFLSVWLFLLFFSVCSPLCVLASVQAKQAWAYIRTYSLIYRPSCELTNFTFIRQRCHMALELGQDKWIPLVELLHTRQQCQTWHWTSIIS